MSKEEDQLHSLSLPSGMVEKVFPFAMVWDRELTLTNLGPSIRKLLPDVKNGDSFLKHFHLERPFGEASWEFFKERTDLLILLKDLVSGNSLRGQVVLLEDGRQLFLCSPWFSSPGEFEESGLTIADFASHDQTTDLLQVVQTQQMANQDLQLLARKLAEKEKKLRANEEESRKLALVAARTDNGVIITDAAGCIEWVNEGFSHLTGWQLEEVIGKRPGAFLQGPETDPGVVERIRERLGEGQGFCEKLANYDREGNQYWVEVEVQPVQDKAGELLNFIGLQRDITKEQLEERRRALRLAVSLTLSRSDSLEGALRKVLAKICDHCEWTAGFFWSLNEGWGETELVGAWHSGDDQYVRLEQEFREREGEIGKDWHAAMSGSGALNWTSDVSGHVSSSRQELLAKAGLRQIIWTPIRGDGDYNAILELFSTKDPGDTGSEIQELLEAVGAQLGQFLVRMRTQEALEESKAEAEAANRAKSEFLATMSHEICTPMNGVLGFAQILQESQLSAQQQGYVSSIHRSANSLLKVINDVLDFSKIEAGHLELESREFDLVECIEGAVETVSASAEEKGLELVVKFHRGVPAMIHSDEFRLRQVLINLLGNAVKFTESGTITVELEVSTKSGKRTLLTRVRDTGIGIEAELLPVLFGSFRQADSSTTRRFGGTGLGLAICRRIVEALGGSLTVESQLGQGSVFSFTLAVDETTKSGDALGQFAEPALTGRRVLLVSAGKAAMEESQRVLEEWGAHCSVADCPREALSIGLRLRPEVVLLDGGYPFDQLNDLVGHQETASSKLHMIVRRKDEEMINNAFSGRLAGVLSRPLRLSSLRDAVAGQESFNPPVKRISAGEVNSPVEDPSFLPSRVLLVEDNKVNQKFVLSALENLGLSVDLAENGLEALEAVERNHYEVILMDLHMPKMDGLEATGRLRAREQELGLSPARIVGVTADALLGSEEICTSAGMDSYLPKPINLKDLRSALCGKSFHGTPRGAVSEQSTGVEAAEEALQGMLEELSLEDVSGIARDFLDDLPIACAEIEESRAKGDLDGVRLRSHSLKGTSSMFHLHSLVDLASRIEELSNSGQATELEREVKGLVACTEQSAGDLQKALQRAEAAIYRSDSQERGGEFR